MNTQQTIDKLNWIKVCTMAEEYLKQTQNPDISSLSFEERFGLLVDSEWVSRQNKLLANLVRKAGMKYNYTSVAYRKRIQQNPLMKRRALNNREAETVIRTECPP